MLEIEFHNREGEIKEIMRILNSRPDLITFVYGPINSGKTELFQHLIKTLPKDFVIFYVNLRERMIKDFNDFVEALFEIEYGKRRVVVRELIAEVTKFTGIPISKSLLDQIFKDDRPKNAFRYIVKVVEEVKSKGKASVLILDELQKIGDVKIDGLLIYELFNLFVRLTKELHSCHVFAITSDSLFIERVFNEAMLHGRCRYLLADDFDYNTTKEFLEKYGFNREEIELTWNYLGGKPVYLVEAIKNKDRLKEFCEELVRLRKRQIKDSLYALDEEFRKSVLEVLSKFRDSETIAYDYLTEELCWCVRNNILFLDPLKDIIKPQSRLDLLAIRNILD
jgi:AAA+ ATPase superfamily predicted ATPase